MFRIVAVFDLKAQIFHQPFAVSASIVAARQFRNVIINKQGNLISDYPEDFELRDLGSFNELEGKFIQEKIETIETGKNVLKFAKILNGEKEDKKNESTETK